jgi:hypothetical protein
MSVLVVCLCADWCNVCGDYRSRFEQVQQRIQAEFPQSRFLWIDVEDDADLLHPLDVENFPTLLLAVGNEPRFFGPITPQAQTLERLVQSHINDAQAKSLPDRNLMDVIGKIRAAKLT